MFLHAGNNVSVRKKDIVGIFDLDSASLVKTTRSFLTIAQQEGRVVNISAELPKSFIVTECKQGVTVYISPISAAIGREKQRNVC